MVLATPNPLTLAATAASSSILDTITSSVARRYCAPFNLKTSPLPFALPTLSIDIVWHSRAGGDAANEWLRKQLDGIGKSLAAPQQQRDRR